MTQPVPLVKGTRYRLHLRFPASERDRVMVLDFLGHSLYGVPQFSARPKAGTQSIDSRYIRAAEPVSPETPIALKEEQ